MSGSSTLETCLAAVWTAARARGFTEVDLVRWMCQRPAALLGLAGRKGRLEVSSDADILIWDPEASFVVDASRRCPHAGQTLSGVVKETYVRGVRVFANGCVAESATGSLITRQQ